MHILYNTFTYYIIYSYIVNIYIYNIVKYNLYTCRCLLYKTESECFLELWVLPDWSGGVRQAGLVSVSVSQRPHPAGWLTPI